MQDTPEHAPPALPPAATDFVGKAALLLALIGGGAMAFCQWLVFVYAPIEATMRLPQKIFYLHLPLAWWGLFSFFIVFIASICYLRTKKFQWDALAGAAAEIGVLLAGLTLITGSIWGRQSWGVWWTWDARLTTFLVAFFVYAAYLLIRTMDIAPDKRSKIVAVIGIAAFLDVPLVFFSARLWSYIHPPSIALEPAMKLTAAACVFSFGLLWVSLTLFRWKLACDERRLALLTEERLLRQDAH